MELEVASSLMVGVGLVIGTPAATVVIRHQWKQGDLLCGDV